MSGCWQLLGPLVVPVVLVAVPLLGLALMVLTFRAWDWLTKPWMR